MRNKKRKYRSDPNKKKMDLSQEILLMLKRSPKKRYHARQIIKKLKLQVGADAVDARLNQLADSGKIVKLNNGKFKYQRSAVPEQTVTGVVDMTMRGSAFIISDELDFDVHVSSKNLNFALDKDKVEVSYAIKGKSQRPTGKIIRIIERATDMFIGTLFSSKNFAFVLPDSNNMPVDIFIPQNDTSGAKHGDKVLVKIVQWHGKTSKSPVGKVSYVLGKAGSSDIEMKSILLNQGFELEFPDAVLKEAAKLPKTISKEEIKLRRDFREITTFTIDPLTAKDFDDALSIRFLENGNCEIGIHIADVGHYVKEGSALDKEALNRSTSVYLVDRVLPMLPEELSNELCSLKPETDRLCFSAVFTFDKDDKVVDRWFGKTVIFSDKRFTYEDAQEILEKGEGPFANELKVMDRLAKKMRAKRFKEGGISFISPEVQFKLAEDGTPLEVFVKEMKDSNHLVEDFMLLANREVAGYIAKNKAGQKIPFVYRIHDQPDLEKVGEFAAFAREMGFNMQVDTIEQISSTYNRLTAESQEKPELKILLPLAIRTMAKAVYSTENIGHFGLAFENYTHFTSPIRRYADVLVHRILFENLKKPYRVDEADLEGKCEHISAQEKKAMDAERESVRYKQVEYIEKHVGELFKGVIVGIIERGIFVELLDNWVEGFAGFDSMKETFTLDSRFQARGKYTGTVLKMGQIVLVRIVAVDFAKRRITMDIIDGESHD